MFIMFIYAYISLYMFIYVYIYVCVCVYIYVMFDVLCFIVQAPGLTYVCLYEGDDNGYNEREKFG